MIVLICGKMEDPPSHCNWYWSDSSLTSLRRPHMSSSFLSTFFVCWLATFYLQSNPIARWHVCQGSINSLAFSFDGAHLATIGRDGIKSNTYHLHFMALFFNRLWTLKLSLSFAEGRLPASFWLFKRTACMWWKKLLWCSIMLCLEVLYILLELLKLVHAVYLVCACFQFSTFHPFYIRSKLLPLEKINFLINNIHWTVWMGNIFWLVVKMTWFKFGVWKIGKLWHGVRGTTRG